MEPLAAYKVLRVVRWVVPRKFFQYFLRNTFADRGDPQAARRALESAYELSKFDIDFNEDARVQLDNLKVQQTMVGLTSWRNQAFSNVAEGGEPGAYRVKMTSFASRERKQTNCSLETRRRKTKPCRNSPVDSSPIKMRCSEIQPVLENSFRCMGWGIALRVASNQSLDGDAVGHGN